jgi:monoamine oxidase
MDDIVDLKLSQWHLDPDTLGSYSAPTTLTQGNSDRRLLAESIDNVVFFAGEHTHYQGRYQSMDGAYETGERAAREVISRLRELQKKREQSEARQASVAETCDQASKERV